jgi:hypothetical protein
MNEEAKEPEQGDAEKGAAGPSEEEVRKRLEEELGKVRVEDVLLQSVVSLVNISARRIAKEDERDLDQARVGIDAVRALVDLLPGEAATQVRNALSELQVLYAKQAGEGSEPPRKPKAQGAPEAPMKPGDSGLWTPPGTTK